MLNWAENEFIGMPSVTLISLSSNGETDRWSSKDVLYEYMYLFKIYLPVVVNFRFTL